MGSWEKRGRYVKQIETGIRLGVHFEKKGAKSALVKPSNLRIAFELPISSEVEK